MNGSLAANEELLTALAAGLMQSPSCEIAVCVPAPYLAQVQFLKSKHAALSALEVGAQDVSAHATGAYSGEVSTAMLKDFACRYAIVGHSERRQYHAETDALVAEKSGALSAAPPISPPSMSS